MDWFTVFILFVLGILSTASCAIGLQCLNKTDDGKNSSNHGYLSFILAMSVIAIVFAIVVGVFKVNSRPVTAANLSAAIAAKTA